MRSSLAILTAIALLAGVPAAQGAQPSQKKAIWGPVERAGVSQFPIDSALGVGIYETGLSWRDAAPQRPAAPRDPRDPAYRWPAELDAAMRESARYGIRVSLLVSRTPAWANGGRSAARAPTRAQDLADFLSAAARRYPGVHLWMIWGEPNRPINFEPRGARAAPRAYARLLDAGYGALKAVSPRNLVIGANTWTKGSPTPREFMRRMRLPNGRAPRMDLYGHNPFTTRRPDLSRPMLADGTADFSDLDTLARWIDDFVGRTPQHRRIPIFISEFSLPTGHANDQFNFHVTPAVQARWISAALRIARSWSRIYTFGYLGLYDQDPTPDGRQSDWGLLRRDGTPRPAFGAYARG